MDHGDNRKEHHQQRSEGQRLLKGMANLMLVGDAIECGQQHDHEQTNQAHGCQMERQRKHQNDGCNGLNL